MPSKVLCYLHTRRKEWDLTQKELASLIPRNGRKRLSKVERRIKSPNALELLAYAFIFNCPPESIFPAYAEEVQEAVMARAGRLSLVLEDDDSPKAQHKFKLLKAMLDRLPPGADTPSV